MKRILVALTFAAGLLAFVPTEADARVTCRATSPTGAWGMGWHDYSLGYARRRALAECAVRTPRGYYCQLTGCWNS